MSRPSRRTQLVWIAFAVSMTVVTAILTLDDPTPGGGFLAASVAVLDESGMNDPVFELSAPLDETRWTSIVIHHLGEPAGDADSVHRLHQGYGYHGLAYHFLIGNGNGLSDGVIHVGYRWDEQLPGVQAVATHGDEYDEHAIGICLIGNGDRRPFTESQNRQLVSLVRRLQRRLGIPADRVYLHRELAPASRSPGAYFPASLFEDQLGG